MTVSVPRVIEQLLECGCIGCRRMAAAEIERLQADVATLSYTATAKATKIERLRALSQNNAHSWDAIVKERNELRAEVALLRQDLAVCREELSDTGVRKP